MTNISFNSTSLQTSVIQTQTIDHFGWPNISVKKYPLAHANLSVIPYVEWPDRTVKISGVIQGSSITDCDAQIDTFRSILLGTDKNLDIDYNGSTRRYIATADAVAIDRPGGLTYANFQVEFVCTDPFGHDTSSTTALTATGRTGQSYNDSYTFLGTAPYQQPIITITLTAVSSSGTTTLNFGNNGTGQQITISRNNWAVNDQVIIDCTQKSVTVNNVPVSFTGAFPIFAPGAGVLAYSDTFTSRTFNITVTYTVRYL